MSVQIRFWKIVGATRLWSPKEGAGTGPARTAAGDLLRCQQINQFLHVVN